MSANIKASVDGTQAIIGVYMESEEKEKIEDYSEKEIRDYVEKWGPDADI